MKEIKKVEYMSHQRERDALAGYPELDAASEAYKKAIFLWEPPADTGPWADAGDAWRRAVIIDVFVPTGEDVVNMEKRGDAWDLLLANGHFHHVEKAASDYIHGHTHAPPEEARSRTKTSHEDDPVVDVRDLFYRARDWRKASVPSQWPPEPACQETCDELRVRRNEHLRQLEALTAKKDFLDVRHR